MAEVKKVYREKSKQERAKYQELASEFRKSTDTKRKQQIKTELTNLCRRVEVYDQLHVAARTSLAELQNTMNISMRK